MSTGMRQRHDTAAAWAAANPVLAEAEIGYIKGTGYIKIGDGVTAWNNLVAFRVANADFADNAALLDGRDTDNTALGNTIPVRDQNGQFKVGTPTDPAHVASKAYADAAGAATKVEVFTATGIWTKQAMARAIEVIAIGAGASGGNGNTGTGGCVGGSGGGRSRALMSADSLPDTVPVTVGSGGTVPTYATQMGFAGSASSFGTYVVADGGGTGLLGTANVNGSQQTFTYPGVARQQTVLYAVSPNTLNPTNAYLDQGGYGVSGGQGAYSVNAGGGGSGYGQGGPSGALVGGNTGQPGLSRSGTGLGGSGGGGQSGSGIAGVGGIPGGGGGGNLNSYVAGVNVSAAGARGEVLVITYF